MHRHKYIYVYVYIYIYITHGYLNQFIHFIYGMQFAYHNVHPSDRCNSSPPLHLVNSSEITLYFSNNALHPSALDPSLSFSFYMKGFLLPC